MPSSVRRGHFGQIGSKQDSDKQTMRPAQIIVGDLAIGRC